MGIHINLTPEQERLIEAEIKSGHYHSVEHVIGEALEALRRKESWVAGVSSVAQPKAVREMLDFVNRNSVRLEDISVKELIHEGHRL
jgi:Arc/MetJ-type ribon-helix-helix transcriptional regulator